MGTIDPKKKLQKLKWVAVATAIALVVIFIVALATTKNFRESFGVICLTIGVDLLNPIPTADWVYFVFPVAIFLYAITPPSFSRTEAVVVAYILSHVAGLLLILLAVLLIGNDAWDTAKDHLRVMFTHPLFIIFSLVMIIFIVAMLYFNFKLKPKYKREKGR